MPTIIWGWFTGPRATCRTSLTALEKAGEYAPEAPESHFQRGMIYLQQGQNAEAQAAFQTALEVYPRYPQAHYNLGIALFNQGQAEAALDAF